MEEFKDKFTRIKGVSERRRLPRLGKIRLGVKVISEKTGNEYPKETEYFVCPDEVQNAYKKDFPNGKITSLDIMFPINDEEIIFPQAYKFYGQSRGLKCIGNGEIANQVQKDGSILQVECPCELLEQKKCQRRAHLLVMLPKISLGGVYQIDVGSYHSIVDINSGIDYIRGLTREILGIDRFALIPLVLKREQKETHYNGKKQIHYTLHIYSTLNAEQWNNLRGDFKIISPPHLALPPIEDINPAADNGAIIVKEENNKEKNGKDKSISDKSISDKSISEAQQKMLNKIYISHLILSSEKKKIKKLDKGKDRQSASELIGWWFGDKEKDITGMRNTREIYLKAFIKYTADELGYLDVNELPSAAVEIARKQVLKKCKGLGVGKIQILTKELEE